MAGQPIRRERAKQAEAKADEAQAQLHAVRINLIRRGLDPEEFGAGGAPEVATLSAYDATLPLRVSRLSGEGQAIEEIRISLGFTEAQEREWADQYVDFAAALARVRAREVAFWQRQARQLAAAGDRAGFTSVSALIDKRFNSDSARGDASQLIQVHIGKPLEQRVDDDA